MNRECGLELRKIAEQGHLYKVVRPQVFGTEVRSAFPTCLEVLPFGPTPLDAFVAPPLKKLGARKRWRLRVVNMGLDGDSDAPKGPHFTGSERFDSCGNASERLGSDPTLKKQITISYQSFRAGAKRLAPMMAAVILVGVLVPVCRADYEGRFVSATAQSPILPGQPLEVTVVVQNSGTFPWIAFDLPAWLVQAENPSWGAGWSVLDYVFWNDVNVDETVTATLTLAANQLPSTPGDYTFGLTAAHNAYDIELWLMMESPRTVSFTIGAANRPPSIDPIADRAVVEGHPLAFTVTATDPDLPAQMIEFSLESGAPAGASINPTNGLFGWTPPVGFQPSTNMITVRVIDDGTPAMSATRSFLAIVMPVPRFEAMTRPSDGMVELRWRSHPGASYRLQYKSNLVTAGWADLGGTLVATSSVTSATNSVEGAAQRFYQVLLLVE